MATIRTHARGFTLIELVTTMVIVGILSAVVVPRFSDNHAFSERGYADELASALRYSQRIASASRCPVRIVVDAAGYSAVQQNACTVGAWDAPVKRVDGLQLAGTVPDDVALLPAATTIDFNENGGASAAAFTIGTAFAVTVDASGRVTTLP